MHAQAASRHIAVLAHGEWAGRGLCETGSMAAALAATNFAGQRLAARSSPAARTSRRLHVQCRTMEAGESPGSAGCPSHMGPPLPDPP